MASGVMTRASPNRRGALGAMFALGAAASAPAERAEASVGSAEPAQRSGPKIWGDLDQQALDAAYDQSVWAPNLIQVVTRYITNSEGMRARLGEPKTIAYGPGRAERLHIYRTDRPDAPIFVFIHGGAWRSATAEDYAFPAEMVMAAGAHFIGVDFDHVQDVGGDLYVVAAQVRRALAFVHQAAPTFGGDRTQIFVGGHSSGGHLTAVLLTTDWAGLGLPADVIKGAICLSGLYDLTPVRLSSRAAYIRFNDAMVADLSPLRHVDRVGAPVFVVCGSFDSPEFIRQARGFADALGRAGKPVQRFGAEGYNHFELMETAANPFGAAGRLLLSQMNLRAGEGLCLAGS
jgi:arylformamidase